MLVIRSVRGGTARLLLFDRFNKLEVRELDEKWVDMRLGSGVHCHSPLADSKSQKGSLPAAIKFRLTTGR